MLLNRHKIGLPPDMVTNKVPTIESTKRAEMPCWQLMGATFPQIIGPEALQELCADLKSIKKEFLRLQEWKASTALTEILEDLQQVAKTKYSW